MTVAELQIQLDLHFDDKSNVLRNVACNVYEGLFFVDSEDGQCYLFDESGNIDDITKVKTLNKEYIKKDIKKIVIPSSITRIGAWVFSNCSNLTSVTTANSITRIGSWAFDSCSNLTSVMIPNCVMYIGFDAFKYCNGLTDVTIGSSVTSIGAWAFWGCNNLKSLIFKGKTLEQVKAMNNYPFGIEDESIIRCES